MADISKGDFVSFIKTFRKDVADINKACAKERGKQIQSRKLLDRLELIATMWFEDIELFLKSNFQFTEDKLQFYNNSLGEILEFSHGRPSKVIVNAKFGAILHRFHSDIIVPVQKYSGTLGKFKKLENLLSHTTELETDYLSEAIKCAGIGKNRACIIMAWCAAVDRLHKYIQFIGFDKLNTASGRMHAMTTGRYKRFNKKFDVQNLSDLRMSIFDRDLLWILEFLGAIDGNQHERLGICLTLRDTCAHPGKSIITDDNILSFFSDIEVLVFANSKFALK